MNKLSLVGMQLPEKYKENFDEGPSLETSKFSSYLSGSCIPTNESLSIFSTFLHMRMSRALVNGRKREA